MKERERFSEANYDKGCRHGLWPRAVGGVRGSGGWRAAVLGVARYRVSDLMVGGARGCRLPVSELVDVFFCVALGSMLMFFN